MTDGFLSAWLQVQGGRQQRPRGLPQDPPRAQRPPRREVRRPKIGVPPAQLHGGRVGVPPAVSWEARRSRCIRRPLPGVLTGSAALAPLHHGRLEGPQRRVSPELQRRHGTLAGGQRRLIASAKLVLGSASRAAGVPLVRTTDCLWTARAFSFVALPSVGFPPALRSPRFFSRLLLVYLGQASASWPLPADVSKCSRGRRAEGQCERGRGAGVTH